MVNPKTNPEPNNAATNKPKQGLLDRLMGLGAKPPAIEIGVMQFVDAAGVNHERALVQSFNRMKGVRTKIIKAASPIDLEEDRALQLPKACADAFEVLGKNNLDLVIWGNIPEPGTTMYIHFVAPPPADEDPPGVFSPFQALMLPVGFDPAVLGGLLRATALAAVHTKNIYKEQFRRMHAPDAIEDAGTAMQLLPEDFTPREIASAHAALANSLASFAHLFPGTEIYQNAVISYGNALKGTSKTEAPINWAYLKKNFGMVLQSLAEKNKRDLDNLELAEASYKEALEVFSLETTPFPWATTQGRLGDVLYRLDVVSGGTDSIKAALGSFQSALKVLSKKQTPNLWSDVMNNLAQAAQLLGREKNNKEVVERAISACRSALEVRKRKEMPLHWAATQNNLGSALFTLGHITEEIKIFEEAVEAFSGARDVYAEQELTRMVRVTEKNIARTEDRLPSKPGGKGDPALWWMEGENDDDATNIAASINGAKIQDPPAGDK
ncbi:MAG: tetratricopeptide repeat protein [Rhodospirillaceae bacterium]|nr:tetratricopeptide repeat protein [Rhodospirillaceae bacterium]